MDTLSHPLTVAKLECGHRYLVWESFGKNLRKDTELLVNCDSCQCFTPIVSVYMKTFYNNNPLPYPLNSKGIYADYTGRKHYPRAVLVNMYTGLTGYSNG